MNVAVVSDAVPPERGGGHTLQQNILRALLELAPANRHRFVVYVASGDDNVPAGMIRIPIGRWYRAKRGAIRLLRSLFDRLNLSRPRLRTWFERSLDEHDIELVWFISHYLEDSQQPFICSVWDLAHLEHPWFPESGLGGEWERRHHYFSRYLPKASCVIVPNGAGKEVLLRGFPIGPERVLELPFPTPEFALEAGVAENSAQVLERHRVVEPYLFYPAQFWAHKNHFNALETLRRLNMGADPPFQLVFAGSDMGQLEYVRRLTRDLEVEDHVLFLGFVRTDDLVVLYQRAHALLYLSFFGPANLPPLEALALGCPVICADVPGMREQLGDAALYAPPTDPDAIGAEVTAAVDSDLRARLIRAGRTRAEQQTAAGYVRSVMDFVDRFEGVRRCWP